MADDPRQAVIDCLAAKRRHPPKEIGRSRGHRIVLLGDLGADPATVEFLKERGTKHRRLYAVNCNDDTEKRWHWFVAAEYDRQSGAWSAHRLAGGGGHFGDHDPWRSKDPRLNLAGTWGANGFDGGGAIYRAGAEVARVRLTFANGVTVEDDAEGDIAVFHTDEQVEVPATLEFLDSVGKLLSSRAQLEQSADLRAHLGP